jgi:hypothetical protein
MRKFPYILILTLLPVMAGAANYTNIYLVNKTGGDAYSGWNVQNAFLSGNNLAPQWTQMTAAQKNLVSTGTNSTGVVGKGSGYGGKYCYTYPPVHDWVTNACSAYNNWPSHCEGWANYSAAGSSAPCTWFPATGECIAAGQPCDQWAFFEFVFQAAPANATSFTVSIAVKSDSTGNPNGTQRADLYLYNYVTGVNTFIQSATKTPVATAFTNSYTSTDLAHFMNASGQITAVIMGNDTDALPAIHNYNAIYAEVKVAYTLPIQPSYHQGGKHQGGTL